MKAGIYFNKNHFEYNKVYVENLTPILASKGVQPVVVENVEAAEGIDVLFVLGGDGTILQTASACARKKIKIIGVNYGHLGFLAEFEPDKLKNAVDLVCGGKYKIQRRSMLEVSFCGKKYEALNDMVIQRNTGGDDFCNTVSLCAEIDGATVDNFSSDGIIISTPTGSTAYSLAAGGSVLAPDVNAFIMTPVCAHSLHSRPVVYGDGSSVTIRAVNSRKPLVLIVDGRTVDKINSGDTVTVKKSDFTADFITENDKNFFNKLLIKLNKWSM